MSRRHRSAQRSIQPDPFYGSQLVAKFINHLMVEGKKSVAESILYDAFEVVGERTRRDPMRVFLKAIDNVRPLVEVKSRRVGGATYQVPIEVVEERGIALALRWIRDAARKRGEKSMMLRLAGEIVDAAGDEGEEGESSRGKGGAVKKREETHRMAEANKAFSHYRW